MRFKQNIIWISTEAMEDKLGTGILIGLGIASVAAGGAITFLEWIVGKEVIIKKTPRPYENCDKLIRDLSASDVHALSGVLIQGKVTPFHDSDLESKQSYLEKDINKVGPAGIVKDTGTTSKVRNPDPNSKRSQYIPDPPVIFSVPFILKCNGSDVIVEKIERSHGFADSMLKIKEFSVKHDFDKTQPYIHAHHHGLKYHMLFYNGTIAAIGKATLDIREGKKIITLYPEKVGETIESLITVSWRKRMVPIILICGGLAAIIAAVYIIHKRRQRDMPDDGARN